MLEEPPVTVFGSPLKRAKGPEAVRPRKARRVEGTPPLLPISLVTRKVPVKAVAKAEEAAPRSARPVVQELVVEHAQTLRSK